MIGRICGTGSFVPEKTVSNDDLAKIVEDEKFYEAVNPYLKDTEL